PARRSGGHPNGGGQRVAEAGLPPWAQHPPSRQALFKVDATPAAGQARVADQNVLRAQRGLDVGEHPLWRDGDGFAGPFAVPLGSPCGGELADPGPPAGPVGHPAISRLLARCRRPGQCCRQRPPAGPGVPARRRAPPLAWLPASSTTSASAMAAAAAEVPIDPVTPTLSGWSSAIAPLPDSVVP